MTNQQPQPFPSCLRPPPTVFFWPTDEDEALISAPRGLASASANRSLCFNVAPARLLLLHTPSRPAGIVDFSFMLLRHVFSFMLICFFAKQLACTPHASAQSHRFLHCPFQAAPVVLSFLGVPAHRDLSPSERQLSSAWHATAACRSVQRFAVGLL